MSKNLFAALASVFGFIFQNTKMVQETLIHDGIKALRLEISKLLYRILMGVILTTVAIYSGVKFLNSIQLYASQFANSYILELLCFGAIATLSLLLLYILLNRGESKNGQEQSQEQTKMLDRNLEFDILVLKFVEGLLAGLGDSTPSEKGKAQSKTQSPKEPSSIKDQTTELPNSQTSLAHPTRDFDF